MSGAREGEGFERQTYRKKKKHGEGDPLVHYWKWARQPGLGLGNIKGLTHGVQQPKDVNHLLLLFQEHE